jgi:hypothetical protein
LGKHVRLEKARIAGLRFTKLYHSFLFLAESLIIKVPVNSKYSRVLMLVNLNPEELVFPCYFERMKA